MVKSRNIVYVLMSFIMFFLIEKKVLRSMYMNNRYVHFSHQTEKWHGLPSMKQYRDNADF